ncbi:hypothetical protein E4T66_12285 [Sinimarinibacterium sp. CAU 1509]|uniref:hypothetical protein n=1 Tax=Sinimarinibacterium sp. CAU 1509 TaxID=2562283 RepID=UPI0010AD688D|nr:hypothetical protein [Sinimarinibacterium sp. CAU 1509]TJY59954.1 hypothetical protein E4T66_12285 [Sinimarinibacterium sp. CAU 1509]
MKHYFVAALLACCVSAPVIAGNNDATPDLLEPGLKFNWDFGAAHADHRTSLRLGLYPSDLGWRRLWLASGANEMSAVVDKPAVLDLRFGDDHGVHLMGLPLDARLQSLGATEGDGASHGNWGLRVGAIVLAAGAATAVMLNALGNAAEDGLDKSIDEHFAGDSSNSNSDTGSGSDTGGGGILCINGVCAIPCGTTGPINSCNSGG